MATNPLPTRRSLQAAYESDVSKLVGRFDHFDELWDQITDTSTVDARLTALIISAIARGYDDWRRARGGDWHLRAALGELGRPYNTKPWARDTVLPRRIAVVAPNIKRLVMDPLGRARSDKVIRFPALHPRVVTDFNNMLGSRVYRRAIDEINAADIGGVPGHAGANFALALLLRYVNAYHLALLHAITPRQVRVDSRLLEEQLDVIAQEGPTTWGELVRGFYSLDWRPMPGLQEAQLARRQWMAPFSQAVISHFGQRSNVYYGNPAVTGWLVAAEVFDHRIDDPQLGIGLATALARKDLSRIDEVLRSQDDEGVLPLWRVQELLPLWQRQRTVRDSSHRIQHSYLARQRMLGDTEYAAEYVGQAGKLYVDKKGLIVQITGARRDGGARRDASPDDMRGIELRFFELDSTGYQAHLIYRKPSNTDGTSGLAPEEVHKNVTTGRWRELAEAEPGVAFLRFNQSVPAWLEAHEPPALEVEEAWGQAPPMNIAEWAVTQDRAFFRVPSTNGYASFGVPEIEPGERVRMYEREYGLDTDARRPTAIYTGVEPHPGAFDVWMRIQDGTLVPLPPLDRASQGAYRIAVPDEDAETTEVLTVKRRSTELPAPIAEPEDSGRWARGHVGRLIRDGDEALVVVSVQKRPSVRPDREEHPVMRVARYSPTLVQPDGVVRLQHQGGRPTEQMLVKDLWELLNPEATDRPRPRIIASVRVTADDGVQQLGTPRTIVVDRSVWEGETLESDELPESTVESRFKVGGQVATRAARSWPPDGFGPPGDKGGEARLESIGLV